MMTSKMTLQTRILLSFTIVAMTAVLLGAGLSSYAKAGQLTTQSTSASLTVHRTQHKTVNIDGVDIFYREAGPKDAPTILLLHGFPTSSHMFRNLIPALSDRYPIST